MEYKTILASVVDGVGIITLNHEPKSIIGIDMLKELSSQLDLWNEDKEVSVMMIRGRRAFALGVELKDLVSNTSNYEEMQKSFDVIRAVKKPIIASVNGYALGIGFELALACDFILASDDAKFAFPEITLNIIPSFGGIQRLARTIGKAKTMEMVLTGRVLNAEEAEKCGIVSRIVPLNDLVSDSLNTAKKIMDHSQKAVRIAKQTINSAFAGIEAGIEIEKSNGELCVLDQDFKQALLNIQRQKK